MIISHEIYNRVSNSTISPTARILSKHFIRNLETTSELGKGFPPRSRVKGSHKRTRYKPDLTKIIKPPVGSVTINVSAKNTKQELLDVEKLGLQSASKPPQLDFGLNRVLYEPLMLHQLYDSRSGVYNFDPKVETIAPLLLERNIEKLIDSDDIGSEKAKPLFITPHKDKSLVKVAKVFSKKYISSTSSMTSVLSHLHFLLSNFRKLNITNSSISKNFPQKYCSFTRGAQFPATIILRKKTNSIISIDSDKSLDREMVLSVLGNSLEDFLTKNNEKDTQEHYHYSKIDDFIIRSQLDAYGSHLPGSGIFDLKTRAVVSVRHDLPYVEKNDNFTGYEIDKVYGEFESLEREFFEVIRSTLLKYSLQARMGFMDGIFLAYHNISKIFGFQYLPLDEIDYIVHSAYNHNFKRLLEKRQFIFEKLYGQEDYIINHQRNDRAIASKVADTEFKLSVVLFKNILQSVELKLREMRGNWQMAKVLVKTETKNIRLRNGRSVSYPVLNVLAFPLPDNYEDIPLPRVSSFEDVDLLKGQLDKIKAKHEELLTKIEKDKSMIGFQVQVAHKQSHHKDSIKVPEYLNNGVVAKQEKSFVINEINRVYYQKTSFDTPNFFHVADVDEWRVGETITPMDNISEMIALYRKYLNEKLDALRFQSIVKESDKSLENDRLSERIKQLMVSTTPNKKRWKGVVENSETEPTEFQELLRAYSLKGLKRSKEKLNSKNA